jgi:hypothetical protein
MWGLGVAWAALVACFAAVLGQGNALCFALSLGIAAVVACCAPAWTFWALGACWQFLATGRIRLAAFKRISRERLSNKNAADHQHKGLHEGASKENGHGGVFLWRLIGAHLWVKKAAMAFIDV